jgi:hypothetical protein
MISRLTLLRFFCLLLPLLATTGCFGYRFGTKTLFRPDVRTIHIPMIRSDSFRAEIGALLTEALQKDVERRTPYKIVDAASADSALVCRLTKDTKRVVGETSTDEPRLLETVLNVEISWTDRRGMPLVETRFLPPGEVTYYFSERTSFVPEAGQSISTALQRAVERLANHIVDQMEARW